MGARLGDGPIPALRVGWEVFAPSYVAHAIALEFDGDRHVLMALTSELMSPLLVLLPSVGVGVGVPVELTPQLRAGGRLQLSIQLPYVGFVATFDLFVSDTPRYKPSVYVQFVF